jgi:hypothetical protein
MQSCLGHRLDAHVVGTRRVVLVVKDTSRSTPYGDGATAKSDKEISTYRMPSARQKAA